MGIKSAEMVAEEEQIDVVKLKEHKAEKEEKEKEQFERQAPINPNFSKQDQKAIRLKAQLMGKGTTVKIVGNHKAFAGQTGTIEYQRDNGEEPYFMVRFRNGMDIFFTDELKIVEGGTPILPPQVQESPEIAPEVLDTAKSQKFENDLEEELVTAIKSRSNQIFKALDQLKNGELDKIQ